MPYARPSTMQSIINGASLLSESRLSSAEPSTCGSSTQNEDNSPSHTPPWQQTVSSSFTQLSRQFNSAARVIATIPPTNDPAIPSILERLDHIEEAQRQLAQDIHELKEQFLADQRNSLTPANGTATTDVEAALKEQAEEFKLDQERLHSRLHNALATKSLSPIRMLPMKNRKTPLNAPSTRGEFEHLTRERYEALLASYEVPITGDTNAKRETLRAFLGIPTIPLEKK